MSNWGDYNQALRRRGDIEIWFSEDAIANWYEHARVYNGTGTPNTYSVLAITVCHEIRQVYRLPLRQCQGFIDSLFRLLEVSLHCPDYSTLSKRLGKLGMKSPRYKATDKADEAVAAIAIDSTGLKRFGRGEWHQEKYKVSVKRSWRKLHIAVANDHIIHAADLTDRFVADEKEVDVLLEQITIDIDHVTADGAYNKNPVYTSVSTYFPDATIVIPPHNNSVCSKQAHPQRNRNLQEIKTFGRMRWQQVREYGRRNYSELAIQRYKRILGNALHAKESSRQKNEALLGCSILNKMVGLGMPASYRVA